MNVFEDGLRRYLNDEQLRLIFSIRIGIGGAGGLGSNIATMLLRTGFQHLEIIDNDLIHPSNLNRQCYVLKDIGKPKTDILKENLLAINPSASILTHQILWNKFSAEKFFKNCDIIVEAFDQASIKKDFVEFYFDKAQFLISGNGMAGAQKKEPMRVTKRGNIYFVGDGVNDIKQGNPPLAPRVMTCAAMMAEVITDLALSGQI